MEIYKYLKCYKCGNKIDSEVDLCIKCIEQKTKENHEYIARLKSQKTEIVKLNE